MIINAKKSTLSTINMEEQEIQRYTYIFPFGLKIINGLKYLGFILNPNKYKKED